MAILSSSRSMIVAAMAGDGCTLLSMIVGERERRGQTHGKSVEAGLVMQVGVCAYVYASVCVLAGGKSNKPTLNAFSLYLILFNAYNQ